MLIPHRIQGDSAIHRLSPALKLALALALIVGTVLTPIGWVWWHVGVALVLLLAVILSKLPPLFLLKRLVLLSPFVLGAALANAWHPAAGANSLALALKSALCLLTVILVSNTTSFSKILHVLKTVHVPSLLVTTMALMHRYLFVLADEAGHMRRARASRTFTRGHQFAWSTLATVVSRLFIRASERAERIYDAMCARGWK